MLLACTLLLSAAHANTPAWSSVNVGGVQVNYLTASAPGLSALRRSIERAALHLNRREELQLCSGAMVYVHPDLSSYLETTGAAWFQLAVADRDGCRIDMQRLPVVAQHGGIEQTLRHELFHLAQPAGWERWRAEGEAQRFAGEQPAGPPLDNVNPGQLDSLLAAPADRTTYLQAMATAWQWVMQGRTD